MNYAPPMQPGIALMEDRRRLEMRYCACLAVGGSNGCPLSVDRILDPKLRALAGAGMTFKDWSVADLENCTGDLRVTALEVAAAARQNPRWTAADYHAFAAIEKAERNFAW